MTSFAIDDLRETIALGVGDHTVPPGNRSPLAVIFSRNLRSPSAGTR